MDYPCTKFGDFSFSHFRFIVQTESHTDRLTDAAKRLSHVTVVDVIKRKSPS